jgi:hypothetical protein
MSNFEANQKKSESSDREREIEELKANLASTRISRIESRSFEKFSKREENFISASISGTFFIYVIRYNMRVSESEPAPA